jgi:hypothetical protein
MSLAEQKRLLGIGLSARDSVYLPERQKASKLKDAVEAFKHALKLRKKGKISSKQLDAAENAALDAGADFDEIDKLRSEAVTEFDIGDKVRAKTDLRSPDNRFVAKGFVGRVVGINERQAEILTTPLISESFDADDWMKVEGESKSKDREAADEAFALLAKNLKYTSLPTSWERGNTKYRKADPDEFMFMGYGPGSARHYMFKHRKSRNYLLVRINTGKIVVPTGGDFMKGLFPESVDRADPDKYSVMYTKGKNTVLYKDFGSYTEASKEFHRLLKQVLPGGRFESWRPGEWVYIVHNNQVEASRSVDRYRKDPKYRKP